MNRKEAIDLLMALAVCSVVELSCEDCPLVSQKPTEEPPYCEAWTEEKVAEAVKFFKENPIEPEPEQEGVWIYAPSGVELGGTDATYDYKCSLCGEYSVDNTKYCPNCGKKMKSGFVWEKDFLEAPKEEA